MGHDDMSELLLKSGADQNHVPVPPHDDVITAAAVSRSLKLVQMSLAYRTDTDPKLDFHSVTPLYVGAIHIRADVFPISSGA